MPKTIGFADDAAPDGGVCREMDDTRHARHQNWTVDEAAACRQFDSLAASLI
jgi:hypothetical protein